MFCEILQSNYFYDECSDNSEKSIEKHFRKLSKNIVFNFLIIFFKLFAQLFYKYGVIYRQVMKTPLIDVCGILRNYKDNLMVQQIIVATNAQAPGLIHECPYDVSNWNLKLKNTWYISFIGCQCKECHSKTWNRDVGYSIRRLQVHPDFLRRRWNHWICDHYC